MLTKNCLTLNYICLCPTCEGRRDQIGKLRLDTSAKGMLTAIEAANVARVRDRVAKGENIFDHIKAMGETQHGIKVQKPDVDIEVLEKRWKEGIEGAPHKGKKVFRSDSSALKELGYTDNPIKGVTIPVGKLVCSFCKKVIDRINSQEGIGEIDFEYEDVITSENPQVVESKVKRVKATKVIACHDCVLNIRPLVNSKGEITNQNVKTYSEG